MAFLQLSRQGAVAELVLARPKVNALSQAVLVELGAALDALAADDSVRGVLLRGEGSCFSAGLDLKEIAAFELRSLDAFLDDFDRAFTAAFAFPKPLAVGAQGHAIAGGLVLALTADFFALARGGAKVGLSELRVGVPFPRVAFEIVRHALPLRASRALRLSAQLYGGAEAHALGVGDALVDDAVSAARSWLEAVVARPAETFRFVKRQEREEPLARIAGRTLAERQALVAAILSARHAIAGALG